MYHLAQHRATVARPPRRRLWAFALAVLAAGAFAAAAPVAGASAASAANVTVTSHFVWTATAANSSGDSTYINNYATNNRPGDILFITPNYNEGGECGCVNDRFPVGVWYNASVGKWAIFNENGSAIPADASFNVMVVPAANSKVFVQTATAANSGGDSTFLNNALTNGRPQVRVMVTQVWNPGGAGGTFNNHPVGVRYDNSSGRWAIFNEDEAGMTAGASFNVMLGNKASGGGASAIQVATTANTSANSTFINYPMTTGNPNAVVFETPNFNPNGVGGTFDRPSTGIWWSTSSGFGGGQAAIFNQDGSAMPRTAAFNLIIYQS